MKKLMFKLLLPFAFASSYSFANSIAIPDEYSVSEKDYNLVRNYMVSASLAYTMNTKATVFSLPSDIVDLFKKNEIAALDEWSQTSRIRGKIERITLSNGHPVIELVSPGQAKSPLNYIRLEDTTDNSHIVKELTKEQEIYSLCSGVKFRQIPTFQYCSFYLNPIEANLEYVGNYFIPQYKDNLIKTVAENRTLPIGALTTRFIGYIMLVGISKDKNDMEKIKSCTPWKKECKSYYESIIVNATKYYADNAKGLADYLEKL
ncbi:hypothetical protein A0174_002892 [Escherichia coli]|nr:hypothetical protein [Escherichia coli]EIG8624062.1 hypothetical protein [Escherichia coli]EIH7213101.1 hypothetical protein [Escherichia coli]EIH8266109.1 hypothetical protein [Escherichia coli]